MCPLIFCLITYIITHNIDIATVENLKQLDLHFGSLYLQYVYILLDDMASYLNLTLKLPYYYAITKN